MIYPKIPLAQSLLQLCKAEGLTHIVVSPGSRNAPLTIGFASDPQFSCYSIADERCAAFFAVGMAQQLKKPVAVLCTSGSALLNYYPAFAEAFYSQIPLVVLSADRPLDKLDIGDGQTIRQQNVYQNHSLYNANLTQTASPENDLLITTAIRRATADKGPVHINIPFEEPLYETVSACQYTPAFLPQEATTKLEPIDLAAFSKKWNRSGRKLVLSGVGDPQVLSDPILERLAADPSVVVMTETTSNLHHPDFISEIDVFITPFSDADLQRFQPEILVTFGGMVVSKRVKNWLRKYPAVEHWHIDPRRAYDTFGILTEHIPHTPQFFFDSLLSATQPFISNYRESALEIRAYRAAKRMEFLASAPFSDLKAYESILGNLPPQSMLQISNSAAIRYAQLIPFEKTVEVYCNRGTSGIDGSTSTAVGAAVASGKRTVMLTGDIGFFYDSNALWNRYLPKDFRIILVNNGGGGIFRILPGHQENSIFNTFFETSHKLTAEHLCKMYQLDYRTAHDGASLSSSLSGFFDASERPCLLEVFTPEKENEGVLAAYFKSLA